MGVKMSRSRGKFEDSRREKDKETEEDKKPKREKHPRCRWVSFGGIFTVNYWGLK